MAKNEQNKEEKPKVVTVQKKVLKMAKGATRTSKDGDLPRGER